MGETEYVIDGLEVKYEGVSNIEEFHEFVRNILENLGYSITEKSHEESTNKKFVIKGKAEKPVDDYTKLKIKIGINASYENVEVKNKRMQKGNFKLKLKGVIERDFQDKWSSPIKRFLRGIYDKFISLDEKENYEEELKEDIYTVAEKAKRFFGMHKL